MVTVNPVVRYLIVCEDVKIDLANPRRLSLIGVISGMKALREPPFPLVQRELCVFVQMTACRGSAEGCIAIQHADSETELFRTKPHGIPSTGDPLEIVGLSFRIRGCVFPEPGLYWFQFWYNSQMLAQHPVFVR